jgi:hypothetical protein
MTNFIRAAVLAAILMAPHAAEAGAQAAGPISFDGLPRKQQQPPQPAKPAVSSDTSAKRRARLAAQRDSIARLKPAPRVSNGSVARVDTLYFFWTDTVRVFRVDTVRVAAAPAPVAAPAKAATAPAVVAPTFTAGGLTQVTFTGGDAVKSTYRLRRVELKVIADLGNRAQAVMMVDAAKALSLNTTAAQPSVSQSSRMLQDAFISMPLRKVTIEAGQQRLPLGYEGAMSASGLETVERALMESDKARSASMGDVRDAGIAIRRAWRAVDYRLGVFNGSGETMNDVDKQVGKAVVGQLAFHPVSLPGLRVGVSGATSGRGAGDNPTRDRLGADARLARGPVAIQLEAMMGQDGNAHRFGWYALSTYAPSKGFKVVSRIDVWDPDLATDVYPTTVGECDYLAGFTWLPGGTRLKLQLNVVHKTYTLGPSSTLVLSQLQASW